MLLEQREQLRHWERENICHPQVLYNMVSKMECLLRNVDSLKKLFIIIIIL